MRRGNFTFRMSDKLRAKVEAAAVRNQRSLSEEVECRLIGTFERGRPHRASKAAERVPLGLRVTPDLKLALDAAAEATGRSQSHEAEYRLQSSFDLDRLVDRVLSAARGEEILPPSLMLAPGA